jgi:hypothetical protein
VPGWKTPPSWAVVAAGDKAAGADVILSMAKRAGARRSSSAKALRDTRSIRVQRFPAEARRNLGRI